MLSLCLLDTSHIYMDENNNKICNILLWIRFCKRLRSFCTVNTSDIYKENPENINDAKDKSFRRLISFNMSLFSFEAADSSSLLKVVQQHIQDAGHLLGPASSAPPPTDEIVKNKV